MERFLELRDVALPPERRLKGSNSLTDHTVFEEVWDPDLHDEENIQKFNEFSDQLSSFNKSQLTEIFEALDLENRVDYDDQTSQEIVSNVELFINSICQIIGEIDPRFRATLMKGGSFYDGTKIGKVDEFDFVFKIDSSLTEGLLEAKTDEGKTGFVYLVAKDKDVLGKYEEFFTTPGKNDRLPKTDMVLSVSKLKEHFAGLIHSALTNMDIPDNIIPSIRFESGEENEYDWQPLRHGPCAKLDLTYICDTSQDVIEIDIDIAPGIDIPSKSHVPPVLGILSHMQPNEFLKTLCEICDNSEIFVVPIDFDAIEKVDASSWSWRYTNTWRVSFSYIEKAIFALYSNNSTEKKLYRILKILKEFQFQQTEDTTVKSGTRYLRDNEPPSTILSTSGLTIQPLFDVQPLHDDIDGESDSSENLSTELTCSLNEEHLSKPCTKITNPVAIVGFGASSLAKGYDSAIYHLHEDGFGADDTDILHEKEILSDEEANSKNKEVLERVVPCPELQKPLAKIEPLFASRCTPSTSFNVSLTESVTINQKADGPQFLKYRESLPLFKTYFIKMLFFAMKTTFPKNEDWTEDKLSSLVVLSLQMLYYAFSSKRKGFLNYWFQDFIANRTRESASVEILYCLEETVARFKELANS